MASALTVGDVVVLLSFSAQARGIQLYEVDCRHLVISCSEEKCFAERRVTCRVSDAHVTENKDGRFPPMS